MLLFLLGLNRPINLVIQATTGAFAAAWSEICTTAGRDMQVVILMTADGFIIDKKVVGAIPDLPDEES